MTVSSADEKQPLVAADPEKGSSGKLDGPGASFHLFVQQYKIPLIVLYYGLCSSTLIVINKVAVHNITVSRQHQLHQVTLCCVQFRCSLLL